MLGESCAKGLFANHWQDSCQFRKTAHLAAYIIETVLIGACGCAKFNTGGDAINRWSDLTNTSEIRADDGARPRWIDGRWYR